MQKAKGKRMARTIHIASYSHSSWLWKISCQNLESYSPFAYPIVKRSGRSKKVIQLDFAQLQPSALLWHKQSLVIRSPSYPWSHSHQNRTPKCDVALMPLHWWRSGSLSRAEPLIFCYQLLKDIISIPTYWYIAHIWWIITFVQPSRPDDRQASI